MSTKEQLLEEIEEQEEVLDDLRDVLDDDTLTPFQRLKAIEDILAEEEEEEEGEEA